MRLPRAEHWREEKSDRNTDTLKNSQLQLSPANCEDENSTIKDKRQTVFIKRNVRMGGAPSEIVPRTVLLASRILVAPRVSNCPFGRVDTTLRQNKPLPYRRPDLSIAFERSKFPEIFCTPQDSKKCVYSKRNLSFYFRRNSSYTCYIIIQLCSS